MSFPAFDPCSFAPSPEAGPFSRTHPEEGRTRKRKRRRPRGGKGAAGEGEVGGVDLSFSPQGSGSCRD